jgi:hypothetical protein
MVLNAGERTFTKQLGKQRGAIIYLKLDTEPIKGKIVNAMGFLKQRKNSIELKAALTLFYLILFGSQLSHKFYQCADSHIRAYKADHWRCTSNNLFIGNGSMLLNYKKPFTLSIDKRYEFKHAFALSSPEISLQFEYSERRKLACFECWYSIHANYVIRPFRGPPSV